MNMPTIAVIGTGNMGSSLIGGLIQNGHPADKIYACDPNQDKLQQLSKSFNVHISTDNIEACKQAEVIILAVKPQMMGNTICHLAETIKQTKALVISIAAGVPTESIQQWIGADAAIVRAMPNTPALLGAGATALYPNKQVNAMQHTIAETIMRAVGIVVWTQKESQIDVVTAISGSGPAYFFFLMEALEEVAIELGLPKDTANLLVVQTALGAAKMAMENEMQLTQLRHHVTSPGGTTERAINIFEEHNLRATLKKAVHAAKHRSEELATMYGK